MGTIPSKGPLIGVYHIELIYNLAKEQIEWRVPNCVLVVCPEIDTKSRGTVEFLIKEVHLLEDPHQCDDDKRENNVLKI